MKIAWFSPLPPERSDIANFTARLRGELEKRFDARFFTEKPGGFVEPSTGAFYHAGLAARPHDLLVSMNADGLPFYNLGNNPVYFAQTWSLSQFKPGIVVLHDVKVHHFFEGIFRERLRDEKRYLDLLKKYHGPLGREAGVAFCKSRLPIEFMAEHFPMTAWAVRNALGVVVHTQYASDKVREATSAPVWTIPLPYEPRASGGDTERPGNGSNERESFSAERRVRLVIFGYLNINRRIIEFLHALATMPEREFFEVRVIGTVFHEHEVNAAVDLLGLRDRITFTGYLPDEQLEAELDGADLAINLRYPTMGEASGSQLRIWDHALPSLVTRTEGYAGLPRDTVSFVRPEQEKGDIQRHLRRFLHRPRVFREKGRRGRRWLLEHHRPATYVDALVRVSEETAALRSRYNRFRLADRVGWATAPWADMVPASERERYYATCIAETV